MTKAQLIENVARATDLPKSLVGQVLEHSFEQIARALRREKRFCVPGFGTFSVRRRKPRAGYNPHRKTAMTIPAIRTVGFRPAPQLKKGL